MALLPYSIYHSLLSSSMREYVNTIIMKGLRRILCYLTFQGLNIKSFLFPGHGNFYSSSTRRCPGLFDKYLTECLRGQEIWRFSARQMPLSSPDIKTKTVTGAISWGEPLGSTLQKGGLRSATEGWLVEKAIGREKNHQLVQKIYDMLITCLALF